MQRKQKFSLVDDISHFFKVILRSWIFFAVIPPVFVIVGYIIVHRMEKTYTLNTTLMIQKEEPNDYSEILFEKTAQTENLDINNYIRTLYSHDLIVKTLERLKVNDRYYILGRVKSTEVNGQLPFYIEVINWSPQASNNIVEIQFIDKQQVEIKGTHYNQEFKVHSALDSLVQIPFGVLRVKASYLLEQISEAEITNVSYGYRFVDNSILAGQYLQALRINQISGTSAIQVSLNEVIIERGRKFLDTLSNVFIEKTLENEITQNKNTRKFITGEIARVSGLIDGLEDVISNYKDQKQILDLNMQQDMDFEELMQLERKEKDYKELLQALEELQKYIEMENSAAVFPPSLLVFEEDQFLKTMIHDLHDLELEKNKMLISSRSKNKNVEDLTEGIQRTKTNLLNYIQHSKALLLKNLNQLRPKIASIRHRIKDIPRTNKDLLQYKKQKEIQEGLLERLLNAQIDIEIKGASIAPKVSVLDAPMTTGAAFPNPKKYVAIVALIALAVAFLLANVYYVYFMKVKNTKILRETTDLPLLGQISKNTNASEFVNNRFPKTGDTWLEENRSLRTMMKLKMKEDEKVILFTSLFEGEGKTTMSLMNANLMGATGKKTLLIELDLHRPSHHKYLERKHDRNKGLSLFLTGQLGRDDIIVKADEQYPYDHIFAGPRIPNASDFLLSKSLQELIDWAKSKYDIIIIDSAPIGLLADVMSVYKNVDLLGFVMDSGRIRRPYLKKVEQIQASLPDLSFYLILNNVKYNFVQSYVKKLYGNYYYYRYSEN